MNVSELLQALETAPPESSVAVRLATGEMCPVSALHIGTGGDAAGTVSLECSPQNSDTAAGAAPEDDMSNLDDVDAMAMKAGVDIGKGKPKAAKKAAPVAPADDDEAE